MKGRAILYSAEELAWLEANRTMVISEYAVAFNAAFNRDVSAQNLHALRKRKGWRTGRTGCFEKGVASWNKGIHYQAGGRSAQTQFKKGCRTGRANEMYQPIGAERVSKDGYRERKIHDGMPFQSRWRLVHLIRWEEINGPIPKGMCLKCLDGDRSNTEPSNWTLIPRNALPHLVAHRGIDYDAAPAELKPTILTIAKLKVQRKALA